MFSENFDCIICLIVVWLAYILWITMSYIDHIVSIWSKFCGLVAWAVWKSEEEKSCCKSVVVHHNISLCLLSMSTSPWMTWIIIHYITTWIIAFIQNVLAQYFFPPFPASASHSQTWDNNVQNMVDYKLRQRGLIIRFPYLELYLRPNICFWKSLLLVVTILWWWNK